MTDNLVQSDFTNIIVALFPDTMKDFLQLRLLFIQHLQDACVRYATPIQLDLSKLIPNASEIQALSKEQLTTQLAEYENTNKISLWCIPAFLCATGYISKQAESPKIVSWISATVYVLTILEINQSLEKEKQTKGRDAQVKDHEVKENKLKHTHDIEKLSRHFRLAFQGKRDSSWIWAALPDNPFDENILDHLLNTEESLQLLESAPENERKAAQAKIRRISDIRVAYTYALKDKEKIRKDQKTNSVIEDDILTRGERFLLSNLDDFPPIIKTTFPPTHPVEGVSGREQQYDQQDDSLVDSLFEPPKDTAISYNADYKNKKIKAQSLHIQKHSYEFPTDPRILPLEVIQQLFQKLWTEIKKVNRIEDYCLMLSLLTGIPADDWLWLNHNMKNSKLKLIKPLKHQGKPFLRIDLDISDLATQYDANFTQSQHNFFALPLPQGLIQNLSSLVENSIPFINFDTRVSELKKELKLPILSLARIQSILHSVLKRQTADSLIADLLCGVSARHNPALYYSSFDIPYLATQYKSAVCLITQLATSFDTEYLSPKFNPDRCGSQRTPPTNVVQSFFQQFHHYLQAQNTYLDQFNAYSFWMWHLVLLLTSCRPVNHTPGALKHIDLDSQLIMISDKEERTTSTSSRTIPLCNFLVVALRNYMSYLHQFAAKYGMLNGEIQQMMQEILNSESPLLMIYDKRKKKWEGMTPKSVQIFIQDKFPLPLNWTRHFGRSYLMEQKLPDNIICCLLGHEDSGHEGFHPHSSFCFADLRVAARHYDQMANDLTLPQVQIYVC